MQFARVFLCMPSRSPPSASVPIPPHGLEALPAAFIIIHKRLPPAQLRKPAYWGGYLSVSERTCHAFFLTPSFYLPLAEVLTALYLMIKLVHAQSCSNLSICMGRPGMNISVFIFYRPPKELIETFM